MNIKIGKYLISLLSVTFVEYLDNDECVLHFIGGENLALKDADGKAFKEFQDKLEQAAQAQVSQIVVPKLSMEGH